MQFAVNDKVRLTAARGSWEGYIAQTATGPGGVPQYEVRNPARGSDAGSHAWVSEHDINQQITAATFSVGESVVIGGHGGTVVADNADGTYDVEVDVTYNRHMTITQTFRPPLWLLAVENGK